MAAEEKAIQYNQDALAGAFRALQYERRTNGNGEALHTEREPIEDVFVGSDFALRDVVKQVTLEPQPPLRIVVWLNCETAPCIYFAWAEDASWSKVNRVVLAPSTGLEPQLSKCHAPAPVRLVTSSGGSGIFQISFSVKSDFFKNDSAYRSKRGSYSSQITTVFEPRVTTAWFSFTS